MERGRLTRRADDGQLPSGSPTFSTPWAPSSASCGRICWLEMGSFSTLIALPRIPLHLASVHVRGIGVRGGRRKNWCKTCASFTIRTLSEGYLQGTDAAICRNIELNRRDRRSTVWKPSRENRALCRLSDVIYTLYIYRKCYERVAYRRPRTASVYEISPSAAIEDACRHLALGFWKCSQGHHGWTSTCASVACRE